MDQHTSVLYKKIKILETHRRAKRAHKKDGCTLIFTSGWLLLLLGSVNRCDQTDNDINPKIYMNHFFSLIKKALFLFWDKKFFSKKKKKKHANLGIFGHFLHSVKRRGRIFLYIGSKIYTRIPPIILPTRFFRFFKNKFFSIFFWKMALKLGHFLIIVGFW